MESNIEQFYISYGILVYRDNVKHDTGRIEYFINKNGHQKYAQKFGISVPCRTSIAAER